jgi:hypothetical protein
VGISLPACDQSFIARKDGFGSEGTLNDTQGNPFLPQIPSLAQSQPGPEATTSCHYFVSMLKQYFQRLNADTSLGDSNFCMLRCLKFFLSHFFMCPELLLSTH